MTERNFYIHNSRWLLACALITFSTGFGQTFFISLFASELRNHFNISHSVWGTIYATGTLASAALMLVLGGLVDSYKARPLTLLIMILFAISAFLMSTATYVWLLPFIIFGLRFCGQGMLSHLAMVFAGRWFAKNRGRTVGIASLGLSISEAVLPYIFVFLTGLLGWRGSWGVATILILVLAIPTSILLSKERNPQSSGEGNQQKQTGMLDLHWKRSEVINPDIADNRIGNQVDKEIAISKKFYFSWKQKLPLLNIKRRPKNLDKETVVYIWGGLTLNGPFITDIDNPKHLFAIENVLVVLS